MRAPTRRRLLRHEPHVFHLLQPALHRPAPPALGEDRPVAQDVVEVLDGRLARLVVLVVGAGVADPPQRPARGCPLVCQVGVLAAVARVPLAEAADCLPGLRMSGERQRPEEVGFGSHPALPGPGGRPGRVRVVESSKVGGTAVRGVGGQVGRGARPQHVRIGANRVGVRRDGSVPDHAVDVETDQYVGPGVDSRREAEVAGRREREATRRRPERGAPAGGNGPRAASAGGPDRSSPPRRRGRAAHGRPRATRAGGVGAGGGRGRW